MELKISHTSGFTRLVVAALFCMVAYLSYSLTKSVYNSYQVDSYIEEFKVENEKLKLENEERMSDYLYYTSDEYADKIAKQSLGLVNPGEKVIILSEDSVSGEAASEEYGEQSFARYDEMSNFELWFDFFFGA